MSSTNVNQILSPLPKLQKNRNQLKICGICGKAESGDWARHWKRQHPQEKDAWQHQEGCNVEEPWCENWQEIKDAKIKGLTIIPLPKNAKVVKGFTKGNSYATSEYRARTEKAKSICYMSNYVQEQVNDDTLTEQSVTKQIDQVMGKSIFKSDLHKDDQNDQTTKSVSRSAITVGQLDRDVIKDLENFGQNDSIDSFALIKVSQALTQNLIQKYAIRNINKLMSPLLIAQEYLFQKSEQFQGVVYISLVFGGEAWPGLKNLVKKHSQFHDDLSKLVQFLEIHFQDRGTAEYLLENIERLDSQQWKFTSYLIKHPNLEWTKELHQIAHYVILNINEFKNFVDIMLIALSSWMRDADRIIFKNLLALPNQEKLTFEEFTALVTQFMSVDETTRINNADYFNKNPLKTWVAKVEQIKSEANIDNVESVEAYIKQFNSQNNQKLKVYDLRKDSDAIKILLSDQCNATAPNNMQMAIAQCSLQMVKQYRRQIQVVRGGQGKSRIAATIALLAIKTKAAQRVHIVFTNQVLLEKDKTDFSSLWLLSSLEQQVIYHRDINFEILQNDIVIFDEADEYIYNETTDFDNFVGQHKCICLTATRGGVEDNLAEKQIQETLGFKIIENAFNKAQSLEKIAFESIQLQSNNDIFDYLVEQKSQQAVLVYATQELKAYLFEINFDCTFMNDEQIDHEMLRKLDEKVDGKFRCLIATNKETAFRGLDYRAPKHGILLLICQSFSHHREAQQAAYRVGRLNDHCYRRVLADISLIDTKKSLAYKAKLTMYVEQNEKRPIIYELQPSFRIQKKPKQSLEHEKNYMNKWCQPVQPSLRYQKMLNQPAKNLEPPMKVQKKE